MKTGFTFALALATLSGIEAKEHYTVKEDVLQQEHKRPHVEESTLKCAYDTASFKLCAQYGATAKVGWLWQ